MAKVWKYIFISVGLIYLLKIAGLPTGTESMIDVLGLVFNSDGTVAEVGLTNSSLFNFIFGSAGILITIAAAAGAVIAGLLTRAKPENIIVLPLITTVFIIFLQAGVGIMIYANSLGQIWISAIMFLLMLPFTLGFLVALVDYFRGID
ncbi:hypothetical protein LCGC14_2207490 [marine sediment metagenome]|uniref:Uncharacterized protein n=1 Tax=marine sediment metagenome TaxID=412755 RepID=A0A0F9GAM0_9ZZZZ